MTRFFVDSVELYVNHSQRSGVLKRTAKKFVARLLKLEEKKFSMLDVAWAKYMISRALEQDYTTVAKACKSDGLPGFPNHLYFMSPQLFHVWYRKNKQLPLAFHEELSALAQRHPNHYWSLAGAVFISTPETQKETLLWQKPASPIAVIEPTQLHSFERLHQRLEQIFESVAGNLIQSEQGETLKQGETLSVELSLSCCPMVYFDESPGKQLDQAQTTQPTATQQTLLVREGTALSQATATRSTLMSLSFSLPWQKHKSAGNSDFGSKVNHVVFDRNGTLPKSNNHSLAEAASLAAVAEEIIKATLSLEKASNFSLKYFWSLDNKNRFMLHHVIPGGKRRKKVTDQVELSNTFFPLALEDPRHRTLIERIWKEAWGNKVSKGASSKMLKPRLKQRHSKATPLPSLHFQNGRILLKVERPQKPSFNEPLKSPRNFQLGLSARCLIRSTKKLETEFKLAMAEALRWQDSGDVNLARLIEALPEQAVWKLGVHSEQLANLYEQYFAKWGLAYKSEGLNLPPHYTSFKRCLLPFELLCAQLLFAMDRSGSLATNNFPDSAVHALCLVDPRFVDSTGVPLRLSKKYDAFIEGLCSLLRLQRDFRKYVEHSNRFLARHKSAIGQAGLQTSMQTSAKPELQRSQECPSELGREQGKVDCRVHEKDTNARQLTKSTVQFRKDTKEFDGAWHTGAVFQFPHAIFLPCDSVTFPKPESTAAHLVRPAQESLVNSQNQGFALVLADLDSISEPEISEKNHAAYLVQSEYLRNAKVWQIVAQGSTLICGVEFPKSFSLGREIPKEETSGKGRFVAQYKILDNALLINFNRTFSAEFRPDLAASQNKVAIKEPRCAGT